MAKALLVTAKEIEKYGDKDPEEAKRIERAVQEITDIIWNNSKTRKKLVKEYFKVFECEFDMPEISFEKLYGLLGKIIDDVSKNGDEITEIMEKYDLM